MQLGKLQIDFSFKKFLPTRVNMGYSPRNWNWHTDLGDFDLMVAISQTCLAIPDKIMDAARSGSWLPIYTVLAFIRTDMELIKRRSNTKEDFTLRHSFNDGHQLLSSVDGDRFLINAYIDLYMKIQSITTDNLTTYEEIARRFRDISYLLTDIYIMAMVYLYYVYPAWISLGGYNFTNIFEICALLEALRICAHDANKSHEIMRFTLCRVFDANRQSA